jgi:glucosylceramidase
VDNYWSEQDLVEVTGVKASITINEAATRQKWLGFSGGLNEAGWEALGVLSETERAKAVELLFGESGLHLGLAQLPIGAGESALGRYFHSEVEGDYAMEHFTIERDEVNLIPYVEAARAANPELSFWAVPWSPPPWMKTNLASDCGFRAIADTQIGPSRTPRSDHRGHPDRASRTA